jgi:uracil-DNA glycosylase family 4
MSETSKLLNCKRCPRLQRQFKSLRKSHPDYWNKPVPASGNPDAKMVIVGLAPGMHGANRTGIPFTGDSSGDLLFKTLNSLGIADLVSITNVVKCLPIKNAPNASELNNCRRFLEPELAEKPGAKIVLFALGGVAHKCVIQLRSLRQASFPFGHGAIYELSENEWLVDSYHCSRYNTQTKRLTEPMFMNAMKSAARLSGLLE